MMFAALALLMGEIGNAVAGVLDIQGNYGNPAGCKFAASNDIDSDDLLLLTPDEVSTYATGCRFVQAVPAGDKTTVVTVICGHEGEDTQTVELMRIEKDADGVDAYTIFSADGGSWGRAPRCP
jgi:hypothetical protein